MPIFDCNRIVITCDFEDNIAVVGGSICGTVNIFVLEPVTLCGAALRYHVDESYAMHIADKKDPRTTRCSFQIEYVLFGHRNTKNSAPIAVEKGHYKYPFAIPVPANCPPSSSFGANGSLERTKGHAVAIQIDHRVDVIVYVANSLMDKQSTYTVPMVVKCTSPALLTSAVNGREAHLRDGMSTNFATKGIIRSIFGKALSTKTLEQANCDLFVYNTAISLAETPFLHFAIRGKINCPYNISVLRVTTYGKGNGPRRVTEEVVGSVTMPPLDSEQAGQRGKIVISPHALQSSTSFSGRFVTCQFFVTMALVYTTGVDAGITEANKVCIPIDVSHGSLADADAAPGVVANTILDGAVMGYSLPTGISPQDYAPIAPVTEGNIAPAAWGGGQDDMRFNRQQVMGGNSVIGGQRGAPQQQQSRESDKKGTQEFSPKVPTTRPPPSLNESNNNNTAATASPTPAYVDYYTSNISHQQPPLSTNNAFPLNPTDTVMQLGLDGYLSQEANGVTLGGNTNNNAHGAYAAPSEAYPAQLVASAAATGDEYHPFHSRVNPVGPIFDENGHLIHQEQQHANNSNMSSCREAAAATGEEQQRGKTAAPLPPTC